MVSSVWTFTLVIAFLRLLSIAKATESPNYAYVSSCMQNVTQSCSDKCAAEDPSQKLYSECLKRPEIILAYNHSTINFHVCVGESNECLKLNFSINYGEDCWGKCSGAGYQQCLGKCKESAQDAPEAQMYLQCAVQMNPAHALFWKCLQELDPNVTVEAMKKAKELYEKLQKENPSSLSNGAEQQPAEETAAEVVETSE